MLEPACVVCMDAARRPARSAGACAEPGCKGREAVCQTCHERLQRCVYCKERLRAPSRTEAESLERRIDRDLAARVIMLAYLYLALILVPCEVSTTPNPDASTTGVVYANV